MLILLNGISLGSLKHCKDEGEPAKAKAFLINVRRIEDAYPITHEPGFATLVGTAQSGSSGFYVTQSLAEILALQRITMHGL